MVGSLVGAQLTHLVSPGVLMLIFAGLMALVAVRVLTRRGGDAVGPSPDCRPLRCGLPGVGGWHTHGVPRCGRRISPGARDVSVRATVDGGCRRHVPGGHRGYFVHRLAGSSGARTVRVGNDRCVLACCTGGHGIRRRISLVTMRRAFGWFVLAVAAFALVNNWSASLPHTISTRH
jgi:hypothetical protein